MNCPVCESPLPPLVALLAETDVGTQCPSCWSRLAELKKPPLVFAKKEKVSARQAPPRRRAA